MNQWGTHSTENKYTVMDGPEEKEIRRNQPVTHSGSDEKGYYLGVCIDRSAENCVLCTLGRAFCEYSLDPRKQN